MSKSPNKYDVQRYFSNCALYSVSNNADPCGSSCGANAVCVYENIGKASCACPLDGDDYDPSKGCSKYKENSSIIYLKSH